MRRLRMGPTDSAQTSGTVHPCPGDPRPAVRLNLLQHGGVGQSRADHVQVPTGSRGAQGRLQVSSQPDDSRSADRERHADARDGGPRWLNRAVHPVRNPIEEVHGSPRERDGRLRVAEEHHPEFALREQGPVDVEPVRVLGLGNQDHRGAVRNVEHSPHVGVDVQLRMLRQQCFDQLAQRLLARVIDQQQHARARQPQRGFQGVEPAAFVRTRCIIRRGWG